MSGALDIDRVTTLLEELSCEIVLPRFRRLLPNEVRRKDSPDTSDDIVTRVDHEMELALFTRLAELLPGAAFVGEEMAHGRPDILSVLGEQEPFWLVDPLDGTRNFVAGRDSFGTMVALVVGGTTQASWIHLPVSGRTFVAEQGAGAFVGEQRISRPAVAETPVGTVYADFMSPELRLEILPRAKRKTRHVEGPMAAAVEYTSLALGEKDYVVYHRLHPWDHVAGALLVCEAGGEVRLADGRSYSVQERTGPCLATASREAWPTIRESLFS